MLHVPVPVLQLIIKKLIILYFYTFTFCKVRSGIASLLHSSKSYFKVNEVSQFMYSRPFKRATSRHEEENEFASLWVERTILRTAYQAHSCSYYAQIRGNITIKLIKCVSLKNVRAYRRHIFIREI